MLNKLLQTPTPPAHNPTRTGWTYSTEYAPHDPLTAYVTATTNEHLTTPDDLRTFIETNGGTIPTGYRARLIEARHNTAAWHRDNPGEDAVTRGSWFYRFAIEPDHTTDITDIEKLIKNRKPATKTKTANDRKFWFIMADAQLAKPDGDGTEGIVNTYLQSVDNAVKRWKQSGSTSITIAILGDCIEGNQSQNGRNYARNTIPVTEEIRLFRRLLLHTIDQFITAHEINLYVVNGNHDDVQRFQSSKSGASDGHATEAAISLHDGLQLNPDRYGHVHVYVPPREEDKLIISAGTTTAVLLHGHQFRKGKALEWLSGQILNRHIGDVDLLLHGHFHSFEIQTTRHTAAICAPTLESESTYYKHRHGSIAKRGCLTFTTHDGQFEDLTIV